MGEQDNVFEKVKIRLLSGIKINDSDFNFMKLNANLFKSIKFIKKRKARKKWLTRKLKTAR
ncbi:hypothetical protein [Leptotrichia massiliensis]|uniref:hypothetical protein n=1 Tax=Leptotrichia massiliensis TaxID=1852388 RepID=UPI0008DA26C5|nr:hypothetical protein [Leptotrichia massiliensis]